MGSSTWNDDFYHDKVTTKINSGTAIFDYDADIKAGKVDAKTHDKLSPYKVTRESRDSDEHPNSNAIMVLFDETGSMGSVPVTLQQKLPQLMGLLLRKGFIEDPQLLFGAIGDASGGGERAPLQIGQFESGVEMDDDLTRIYLEGQGGGQTKESYELAMYFAAKHTSTDCFEKRGKKGYLFIVGDEQPYPEVKRDEVSRVIGDNLETNIPTKELVDDLRQRYEVFFMIPEGASYTREGWLFDTWAELLGSEHVIRVKDPDAICESIALAIGLMEGKVDGDDLKDAIKDAGIDKAIASTVATALTDLAKSTALVRAGTATGNLPEKAGKSTATERL